MANRSLAAVTPEAPRLELFPGDPEDRHRSAKDARGNTVLQDPDYGHHAHALHWDEFAPLGSDPTAKDLAQAAKNGVPWQIVFCHEA